MRQWYVLHMRNIELLKTQSQLQEAPNLQYIS